MSQGVKHRLRFGLCSAKESLNAAKSVAAAKQNELKEAINAHNKTKCLVAEIREAEANIGRQLRDSAEPQMCHNLEAVQDAWNDETTHEFGGDPGCPGNNAEPSATRQAEVESESSRNNGKVSSNQDKDKPRRYRCVGFQGQGQAETSTEDDRPRRREHPDEQQEEDEEEDDDDDDEHRISPAHQANLQRRSSKGKEPQGISRMAASSQATHVLGGAQQCQARTVDHEAVSTDNSRGQGKVRGGANILKQDHEASSAYARRINEAREERTGRRHHGNRQQDGGRAADQSIPKKRVRSAGQKITPGRFIEGAERAPPQFAVKFRRRSWSSPSVSRAPDAVAEISTNAQTGASSESNAVATTTTEAAMRTGKAEESPDTESTSEIPAALARVELSCKAEPSMSEG
ncbi:unnamed protein product [Ectocarpus sp. CCAP 1310/34]|nr:unnamed protein product [Ectocarpus sp. CCAP 1310/34]